MKALTVVAVTALLLTAVAGCGQKGPLYLPEEASASQQPDQASGQPAE